MAKSTARHRIQTERGLEKHEMARRVVTREAGPGFFGWLFLLIFLAFNAFMVVFLVIYWNLLAGMPPTATGSILGTGAILFFWVSGAVITGLLVLLTRGLPGPPP
jgi:hypothetical protein